MSDLLPGAPTPSVFRAAARSEPAAVAAVVVPAGTAPQVPGCLAALARSEGLAGLRLAHGALAVLVLAEEEAGRAAVEALALGYPFPLRVEVGPLPFPSLAAERAASWGAGLGIPETPVLVLDARHRVAPGWAYAALSALRDGADLARGHRPGGGLRAPLAARAASVMALPWWRVWRVTV